MNFTIESGCVYQFEEGKIKMMVGMEIKVETIRKDNETVEDITSVFSIEEGKYIEQSRVSRSDPLPDPDPTPDQIRIAELEDELLQTKLALAELGAASEQDKIVMQLALAELAGIITGGVE